VFQVERAEWASPSPPWKHMKPALPCAVVEMVKRCGTLGEKWSFATLSQERERQTQPWPSDLVQK
jgi:hypothetical protein